MANENEDHDEIDVNSDAFKQAVQEALNQSAKGIKRKARASAVAELLEDLGFESLDEMKTAFSGLKKPAPTPKKTKSGDDDADDTTAAELQSAREERDRERTRAEKAEQEALKARKVRFLVKAGLTIEAAEKAARMVDIDKFSASDDDLEEAVDDLLEAMPQLITKSGDDDDPDDEPDDDEGADGDGKKPKPKERTPESRDRRQPPNSNPGGAPSKRKRPADPRASARARLEQRHGRVLKKNNS